LQDIQAIGQPCVSPEALERFECFVFIMIRLPIMVRCVDSNLLTVKSCKA